MSDRWWEKVLKYTVYERGTWNEDTRIDNALITHRSVEPGAGPLDPWLMSLSKGRRDALLARVRAKDAGHQSDYPSYMTLVEWCAGNGCPMPYGPGDGPTYPYFRMWAKDGS